VSDGKRATSAATLPVWPTPIRRINQGVRRGHVAWDIDANLGDPVRAAVAGLVERLIQNEPSGYGNLVVLRDAQGNEFYYGHNSAFAVQPGDRVRAGQVIALAGSTGRSTGPHVHFEIRDPQGRRIDPGVFFAGQAFQEIAAPVIAAARTVAATKGPSYEVMKPSSTAAGAQQVQRQTPSGPLATAIRLLQTVSGAAPATAQTKGTTLFSTPLGDVTLAPHRWWNVAAVGGGAVLALIGTVVLMRPVAQRAAGEAEKIAPLVAKVAALAAV
jgi:hypothetical protein